MADSENRHPRPLDRYRQKRDFARHARAGGQRLRARASASPRCRSSSRSTGRAAALRLPARARRRAAELGGAQGAVASTRRRCRWRSTSRTIRSTTAASRARSRRSSTAPATVIVWDRGTWEPVGDPRDGMAKGKLLFRLHGEKLAGLWELVRIAKPGDKQDPWMLFKKKDEWARPLAEYDVIAALPDSVVAKPLGLRRGARAAGAASAPPRRPRRPQCKPDLASCRRRAAAGAARTAARDPGRARRRAATGSSRPSSTATG